MARYTAVLLAIVFGAASARMLLCESSCANATPAAVREACHDQPSGKAPLTQLNSVHSCDHSDAVFTLKTSTVTFERFASSIAVPSFSLNSVTANIERLDHSPPGPTHNAQTRAVTNLRI